MLDSMNRYPYAILAMISFSVASFGQQIPPFTIPFANAYCSIDSTGTSILPSGRGVNPAGERLRITRSPFGMAVSPNGKWAVILHNDAITRVDLGSQKMSAKRYPDWDGKGLNVLKGASFIGAQFGLDSRRVYLSGGDRGVVLVYDVEQEEVVDKFDLNDYQSNGTREAFATDLVVDELRGDLWVLDRAWWQLYRIDLKTKKLKAAIPTGRIPFGLSLSPDGGTILVANVGLYTYPSVPGAESDSSKWLARPPYGALTPEAQFGTTLPDGRFIPGLGDPLDSNAMSVWLVDTKTNQIKATLKTGRQIGTFLEDAEIVGGSHPNSIVCSDQFAYVTQSTNDGVTVIDYRKGIISGFWPIQTATKLDDYRGYMPYGIEYDAKKNRLYVALLGFNSVAVLNAKTGANIGMLPTGWGASRVKLIPNSGDLLVTSIRGFGAGPNGGANFASPKTGTYVGDIQQGLLQRISSLDANSLTLGRKAVLDLTIAPSNAEALQSMKAAKEQIKHIVYITKENRTFDEVLSQVPGVVGDSSLARFGVRCDYTADNLALVTDDDKSLGAKSIKSDSLRSYFKGMSVTPNHRKIAETFSISDNFYCDSDASIHGHHWMMGTIPNEYVETNSANAGRVGSFSVAPGRRMPRTTGAQDPEDYNEIGGLWEALERNNCSFFNFGQANEYTAVREEWYDTILGAAESIPFPMPKAVFGRTSWDYAGYNMNIPDQFRVEQFERNFTKLFLAEGTTMPQLITLQLPNDHTTGPRPKDGYPFVHSYVADNDLALGRILQFLSHTPYWKNMLVVVTEDDPQGGVDHIDAHRSILMLAGPHVKRGYVSKLHHNFGSILATLYGLLGIPFVNQYDAVTEPLWEFFTTEPNFTPFIFEPSDARLFDPEQAMKRYNRGVHWTKIPSGEAMDDEQIQRAKYQ